MIISYERMEISMKNQIIMPESVTNGQMNSFIITTKEGKVIVMDGGFDENAEDMINWLKKLTGQDVPHVDAWFLSHIHMDHVFCFLTIMEKYPEALDIERIYYNFPSRQCVMNSEPTETSYDRFLADLPRFIEKCATISTGDVFDFGSAHIEVLCSPSPEFTFNACNDNTCVLMLTMCGKKVLFLGDAGVIPGKKMLSMYKGTDKLKADMVQMGHHGQGGPDKEFYAEVGAKTCIWCTPKWLWDNDIGNGYNTYIFGTIEVRGWMDELGVEKHYVLKDGVNIIDF